MVTTILSGCNPLSKTAKSGLQVITDGVESSVFLDDQYLEKSPFINRDIKPGEYLLKIQPDDPTLVSYETKIRLRPGLLTVVTWKLAQRPELSGGVIYEMEPISSKNKSEVSFVTIPDGAIVSLQGKEKEFSPVIITDVNPDHNEFEVSLPSYESQKHTINVVPGYRMLVNVKLAKINIDGSGISDAEVEDIDSEMNQESIENIATNEAETNLIKNSTESAVIDTESQVSPPTQDEVIINTTNFFNNGEEVLRVRDKAGSTGLEIGFAKVGTKYKYLGKTESNWLYIDFNGKSGWVSGEYAQIVKVNQ